MKRAPRFPSRWAGWRRSLAITATLTAALGACTSMDNVLYGAREGTMEYPGSAAGPNAVPTYVVRNKDTVDGIASRYGVSTQSIVERNRLQAPYSLRPGQTLEVPGAKYVPASEPVETASAGPSGAPPSGPPGAVKRESLPPPGATEQKTAAASGSAASGAPTPLSPQATASAPVPPPRLQWPLHGKIIAPYGTANGQTNDGIDIAADNGAPIKAADDGEVVYVGDEVARLGNLVLVEHAGGYITAYGNTDAALVKKGDTVRKGQTIARAGASGGAASPRLHFEVRRGGSKTVDPMTVLPAQ
ncbi:MAG: M23 family metallopeptidase [Alphaproteobacteria bacterium]|nr:MAG: M23 family metallopeptidase [Alphaproteobacteria bacterium]